MPYYRFTGKELDPETGLYYYGARYYDPVLSKWISADQILGQYLNGKPNGGIFMPANLGLYTYTINNPLILIDADGNAWLQSGDSVSWVDGPAQSFNLNQTDISPKTCTTEDALSAAFTIRDTLAVSHTPDTMTVYGPSGPDDITTRFANDYGLVQFPETGPGIGRYGTRDTYTLNKVKGQHGDNWITPKAGAELYNAVQEYLGSNPAYAHDTPLQYNDISAADPKINLGHKTHNKGTAVDQLYMNKQGKPTATHKNMDLKRQNAFTSILQSHGFNQNYSHKGKVTGTKAAPNHHHHQHTGRKEP